MISNKFKILPIPYDSKMRIGLMGGSFNPAHEGHKYITLEAIKRFKLDLVIWFVTPQNPLKVKDLNVNFDKRLIQTQEFAKHPKILVSDFEKHLGNTFTITLLKRITQMHPQTEFCFIMGADNMAQFSKWKNWEEIIKLAPLLIFDREDFHNSLISSKMYMNFPKGIVKNSYDGKLNDYPWYFIKLRKNSQSSTKIRHDQTN